MISDRIQGVSNGHVGTMNLQTYEMKRKDVILKNDDDREYPYDLLQPPVGH